MNIGLVVLMALALNASAAAVPERINFQGRLTDAADNPITGSRSITFSIWDAAAVGNQLWSETQSVTVSSGIYNVALGDVTPLSLGLFAGPDRWLQIKVEADPPMTPRLKMQSVAYAFVAERAERSGGLSVSSGFGATVSTNLVVGRSTFSADGWLAVPGTVTAGRFVGDGSGLTNLPTASGPAGISLEFPDGISGMTPVWTEVSLASPYTVPGGKNFYILEVIPGDYSGVGNLTVTDGTALDFWASPVILGPGTVVTISPAVTWIISGFLVPRTVTAVVKDLAPSASYVVPAGSYFCFFSFGYADPYTGELAIDGLSSIMGYWPSTGDQPIVLGPGQVITNTGGAIITLNGYLKPL